MLLLRRLTLSAQYLLYMLVRPETDGTDQLGYIALYMLVSHRRSVISRAYMCMCRPHACRLLTQASVAGLNAASAGTCMDCTMTTRRYNDDDDDDDDDGNQ